MELGMEMNMREIEAKDERAINCLGNLDTSSKKCEGCPWAYECLQLRRMLRHEEFKEGKHRRGFGRKKKDKKTGEYV